MRILDAWILDNSKFVVHGIEFDHSKYAELRENLVSID
jgi:hypothetical protein